MADLTIDYTSRDYPSLRSDMIALIPEFLPEWTNRSNTDFGIVMIDLFAYMGDILSYYLDRTANEAYISTAVQRASVLSHAAMLDYRPTGLAAASVTLSFTVPSGYGGGDVTVPAGTQVSTVPTGGEDPIIFETDEEIEVVVGTSEEVTATEGRTFEEDSSSPVGVSDGSPDQIFVLYYTSIIEDSLQVYVDEDGVGAGTEALWAFKSHLIDATSEERAYTTFTDENGNVSVIFGDGANGRIPPQGAVVTAIYRVGVGTKGNVGAGTITEPVSPLAGVSVISNADVASGGADVESIDSIRKSAPLSLSALNRAVTAEDFRTLAKKVPGVQHAKAAAAVYTSVTLYIAPVGGGVPSDDLEDDITNYLADKKMATVTVSFTDPTYVPVNVTVNPLNVLPQYNRTAVKQAVENAIASVFNLPDVDFAFRVSQSLMYQAIAAVEGVDYATLTVLSETTGVADVQMDTNEIPTVGTVTVTATGGLVGS